MGGASNTGRTKITQTLIYQKLYSLYTSLKIILNFIVIHINGVNHMWQHFSLLLCQTTAHVIQST